MSRRLSASLLSAVVALSPIPIIAAATPAAAQVNVNFNIGFDYFYNELSPYGDWHYHPRWGDVWQPTRVGGDFRPYFRGYWVNTEYGMTWESPDPWGDIAYHYGRWVYDPFDGWLWVPGYTWAPAWVVWRQGGGNIGWFPMPPDDRFLAGYDVYRDDWDWDRGHFGYTDWYGPSIATGLLAAWTFVALDRFADRDYYRYAYPRPQVVNIINNTTNVTNYVTVNNRIVNRSINVEQIERASNRRIERVEARNVVRTPITTVETGRQVQVRERERHGGDVRAPARERVRQLSREEARTPIRERRAAARVDRDQQPQQPGVQQQQPGGPAERGRPDRDQKAIERRGQVESDQQGAAIRQREERAQALQRERDDAQRAQAEQRQRGALQQREQPQQQERAIERPQREDRAAAQRDLQERAQAEQQNRARAEQAERQRGQAEQQARARADQEKAQREQIERQRRSDVEQQQNRARAEQAERAQQAQAEQQNRARAEQAERVQRAQVEQRAQAEQQNRARAEQAERTQRAQVEQQARARAEQQARVRPEPQADEQQAQRQAAAEQRRAKQQKDEEERQRRERN